MAIQDTNDGKDSLQSSDKAMVIPKAEFRQLIRPAKPTTKEVAPDKTQVSDKTIIDVEHKKSVKDILGISTEMVDKLNLAPHIEVIDKYVGSVIRRAEMEDGEITRTKIFEKLLTRLPELEDANPFERLEKLSQFIKLIQPVKK